MAPETLADPAPAIADALRTARRVVVCGHVTPDGDAIGSVLGLTLALRIAGVHACPTLADHHPAPSTYAFLDGFDAYRPADELEAPDVFVAMDTPTCRRLGVAEDLARAASTLVVIDHHPDGEPFGALRLVDTAAASTASLVWRLLPLLAVSPDAAVASACYAALLTDTGRFSYGNTTASALRDAAEMVDAGAEAAAIYTHIYETRSAASLALLGRVLSRVALANAGRVAYSWMTDEDLTETGALTEDTENLVDAVRQIGGVEAIAFFRRQRDSVKVSLRAKSPAIDVASVAKSLGGGGHAAAAGGAAPLPLESAIEAVLARLPGGAS
jgi:phosphoesterase RecJ-like protein